MNTANDMDQRSVRDDVVKVMRHQRTERIPFVDRMDIWYRAHRRAGTIPEEFRELALSDIHQQIGLGEELFAFPCSFKLHGVQIVSKQEGETIIRAEDPIINHFPDIYDDLPSGRVGIVETEFLTPLGSLHVKHEVSDFMIQSGLERPYLKEHPIKSETDYRVAEYILERAETIVEADRIYQAVEKVGDGGYAVPLMRRIPFQQLMLEYLGEAALCYSLVDNPELVKSLLAVLDLHFTEMLQKLSQLDVPYVEFCDNIEGTITSPRLYKEYCLPYHQRYIDILRGQGKLVGSHADGNLKPLLYLLAEAGLDVCESFTPAPVTACTFEDAWEAWQDGPLIWGGIPSVLIETQTDDTEFRRYIDRLFDLIGDRPIILGIGDMVMPETSIERLRYIAKMIEEKAAHC